MFFEKIIHGSNQTILNFELTLFSEKLKQYLLICSDVPFTGTVHAWFHSQKNALTQHGSNRENALTQNGSNRKHILSLLLLHICTAHSTRQGTEAA